MPTHLLLGIFAGWLNRHRQAIIEYLRSENEILKRQLNGRRPRLTDEERRLLAVKRKALGRKVLEAVVYYHEERNHQGRGGQIIEPGNEVGLVEGTICRRERVGGMFNYYYRDAA
jgi:hypothetical protein